MNGRTKMMAAAAATVMLAASAALSGCDMSSEKVTDENGVSVDRFDREGGWKFRQMNVITDEKTGVQYLIVESFENDVAVCPLLNADGTPCTEENE